MENSKNIDSTNDLPKTKSLSWEVNSLSFLNLRNRNNIRNNHEEHKSHEVGFDKLSNLVILNSLFCKKIFVDSAPFAVVIKLTNICFEESKISCGI